MKKILAIIFIGAIFFCSSYCLSYMLRDELGAFISLAGMFLGITAIISYLVSSMFEGL